MRQDMLSGECPPEAEAVIREARRRQRRRRLVIGVAVVAAAVAAGVVASVRSQRMSQPRPGPAVPSAARQVPGPIPHGIGTTVLLWPIGDHGWPPAYMADLSTGRLSRRRIPLFGVKDEPGPLVPAGRWVVYAGRDGTMAIPGNLIGKPRVLGNAGFFAPAASPGHVWLELFRSGYPGQGRPRVWDVTVRTGRRGPPVTLPRGSSLVAGTKAGLLLAVPRGHDYGLALLAPHGALTALPDAPWQDYEYGFATSPQLVAYGTGCTSRDTAANDWYATCTVLRVLDVVTGRVLSFPAPPGTAGWTTFKVRVTGAIAPGSAMITAYAATRPLGQGHGRLFVIRLTSATRRVVPVPSSAAQLYAGTAWSADGSWLLYQGPGGRMWAYQVSSGRARASRTPCCPYTVMVTFPTGHR